MVDDDSIKALGVANSYYGALSGGDNKRTAVTRIEKNFYKEIYGINIDYMVGHENGENIDHTYISTNYNFIRDSELIPYIDLSHIHYNIFTIIKGRIDKRDVHESLKLHIDILANKFQSQYEKHKVLISLVSEPEIRSRIFDNKTSKDYRELAMYYGITSPGKEVSIFDTIYRKLISTG